jgi:hypothetical protein
MVVVLSEEDMLHIYNSGYKDGVKKGIEESKKSDFTDLALGLISPGHDLVL